MQNGGKKCKLTRKLLDGCRAAGFNDRVKSESAFAGCSAGRIALTAVDAIARIRCECQDR